MPGRGGGGGYSGGGRVPTGRGEVLVHFVYAIMISLN